ncbi:flagellar basal-body rod protein FlgF [Ferrigenium kumadai]|uniref:Flagellar basal-body rod protein FlgF n=1 Tax=Ferrigenium kumadai TaxID=1682490 RepID=A0AAN1SZ46_9PROT|nr:flagellar basal-body rod protein FlgF [Ferrigenium kumadai]BBI98760.1 flagellar basal-body rod protein FlgF [Ferrigenium kumadai]
MDRLIYTAMTGASHVLQQQAAVSENLSNANTPGFRATLNTFRAVPLVGEGLPTRTFVVDSTAGSDFTPAAFQPTGRELDVAVNGAGWLVVQGPDGKEAYTRNGSFQITPNGVLQTRTGLNVVGDAGPITIPPDTGVTFAKDGTISTVPTDPAQAKSAVTLGRLKLVSPDPAQLERGGDGLFRLKSGPAAAANDKVEVVAGNLEGSNVNTVEAMVSMISLARKFDMQMKMLQSADNNAQRASQIMSLAG